MVGSAAAAEEWGVQPVVVDDVLLDLSDEIRSLGLRTAVLTNGTDTISSESKLVGADSLLMRTHLFEGVADLRERLNQAGVEVSQPTS